MSRCFHFTLLGSKYVQARSSTAIDILLGDLAAAENQRHDGVTKSTRDKEARVWKRWTEYCSIIENDDDIYLQRLAPPLRTALFGAFAAALRRRQFSKPDEKELGAGTISETLAKLVRSSGQMWGKTPSMAPASPASLHGYLASSME